MSYPSKSELKIGDFVKVEIYDRGETRDDSGRISEFLTNVDSHPRGIKVRLHNSVEGRVKKKMNGEILRDSNESDAQNSYGKRWSDTDDLLLKKQVLEGTSDDILATFFKRNKGAIRARIIHFIDQQHAKYDEDFWKSYFKDGIKIKTLPNISSQSSKISEEEATIEFKETFWLDTKEQKLRKEGKIAAADGRKGKEKEIQDGIKKEISIACTAFANTNSGVLEIGKTDGGNISEYFESDKKRYKNWDEYTRAIITSIKEFTDDSTFALSIKILNSSNEQDTLRLEVPKSKHPVFISDNGKEEFYVRSNAAATSQKIIKIQEQIRYFKEHFPNWSP